MWVGKGKFVVKPLARVSRIAQAMDNAWHQMFASVVLDGPVMIAARHCHAPMIAPSMALAPLQFAAVSHDGQEMIVQYPHARLNATTMDSVSMVCVFVKKVGLAKTVDFLLAQMIARSVAIADRMVSAVVSRVGLASIVV